VKQILDSTTEGEPRHEQVRSFSAANRAALVTSHITTSNILPTQVLNLLVGVLLDINAKLVAALPDASDRTALLTDSSILLLQLNPGSDICALFEHFHRAKDSLYKQELSEARRKFRAQYCHRHVETQSTVAAATPLATEDANSLFNRIAVSENSHIVLRYYEQVVLYTEVVGPAGAGEAQVQEQTRWEDAVGWDSVTDAKLAELSQCTDGSTASEQQWSIVGVALFGLSVLRALQPAPARTAVDTDGSVTHSERHRNTLLKRLPMALSYVYLCEALRPYAWSLLRTPLATREGLELACLVLNPHTAGTCAL
jgi:molybdopterin-binding protein